MGGRRHDEGDEDEGEQEAGEDTSDPVDEVGTGVGAHARARNEEAGDGEEADDAPAAEMLSGHLVPVSGSGEDVRMGVEDQEGQHQPEKVEGVVAGPEVTRSKQTG